MEKFHFTIDKDFNFVKMKVTNAQIISVGYLHTEILKKILPRIKIFGQKMVTKKKAAPKKKAVKKAVVKKKAAPKKKVVKKTVKKAAPKRKIVKRTAKKK